MFRAMRRIRQQLSDAECTEILKQELRGVLSVLGDGDYPYGIPMDHWYCEADGKLYFHCGRAGHKLDAVRRHDKVSYCVCDQGSRREGEWALQIRSVIVFGRLRVIDDPVRLAEVVRQLGGKFTSDTAYLEDEIAGHGARALLLELTPEHITGKLVNES